MKTVVDENLHGYLCESLVAGGHEVVFIAEIAMGIPDEKVIEVVEQHGGVLITEDKDFGELVFAHGIAKVTVVFLRYRKEELKKMAETLLKVLSDFSEREGEFFITITSSRIRIRQL